MIRMLWVSVLAGLVGCAGAGPSPEQQASEAAKHEAIEDILNKPLSAEEYAQKERCLSARAYHRVDVLDDGHLVFKGMGDKVWLNQLRNRCVGLRRNDILQFDMREPRLCDLDTFQSISPFMGGISSSVCALGKFTPVTPEQVKAIELAVKEARDRR